MPDLYVKRQGQGVVSDGGGVVQDAQKKRASREYEKKVRELASAFVVPEGTKFEIQEEEEEIILLLRAHWFTNVKWILTVVVMAVIPLVVGWMVPLGDVPEKFKLVGGLFWYLITIAFAFEQFLNWYFNVYIVTDERIVDIDFMNLLYKKVSEAKLDNVQDVTYSQGGVARSLLDYGSIFVQTAAEVSEFEFHDVPRPDKVTAVIRALLNEEEQEELERRVR